MFLFSTNFTPLKKKQFLQKKYKKILAKEQNPQTKNLQNMQVSILNVF